MFTDSSTSAAKEISIFFPDFDIEQWYKKTEIDFRLRRITYNESNGLHELVSWRYVIYVIDMTSYHESNGLHERVSWHYVISVIDMTSCTFVGVLFTAYWFI